MSLVPGPGVAIFKLQAKRASLDHAGLTENFFWLPAKKLNIQACAIVFLVVFFR
jgi:hypothetical protein